MTNLPSLVLTILVTSIVVSCQNKKPQSPVNLTNIELLRGDITLCGSGDFGEVSFALSCDLEVRETFDLAISLLHSFEYDQAEKAFVNVIDADPNCAMAYWGVAMSNFHSLWFQSGNDYLIKGSKILEASNSISKTEREADYINAIASFYQDWESETRKTRIFRFEENMKKVYEKYNEDKEAAIFYALALRASADPGDKTYKNQRASGKILESIYPNQPNHPGIAHYVIHNYDYPELAELALPAARRYAEIAPASAHAQHMPSHIFTRLGLWEESINSNINMISSAQCYAESLDSAAHWDEELHGMDYLVYAYLQTGQNEKATQQLEYLKTFERVWPINFKVYYTAAAVPARIALENRNWEEAAALELPTIEMDWTKFPWQRSILHYARALGSIRLGDVTSARNELDILKSNRQELLDIADEYKANQVQIQIKSIQAWIAWAEGKESDALVLMEEAMQMEYNTAKHAVTPGEVLPAGELYGDLLIALDKPEEALKVYEYDLLQHPNRFNGIYGAATAAKKSGNSDKATMYFKQLLELTENSMTERKEIEEANKYLNI
jgi:Tfp pilus assembly protein PilF